MVEALSDLREPPRVGRVYLVPAVTEIWCGKEALWPVLGPMHTDARDFSFPWRHYHLDARFLSRAMLRGTHVEDIAEAVGRAPLSGPNKRAEDGSWIPHPIFPKGRPEVHPFRCIRQSTPYLYGETGQVQALRERFGRCSPIVRPDGRKLCPHRRADLSNMVISDDGTVTCPLHGLIVQVAA